MMKNGFLLLLFLACFSFCNAQTTRAEKQINQLYTAKPTDTENTTDTLRYFLIKFKDPALALKKGMRLVKRISYDHYIVASAKNIGAGNNILSASKAGPLWKASDDLAQLSNDHPNSTKSINLVVKQTDAAVINQIKQAGTITAVNGSTITITVKLKNLQALLQNKQVLFASPYRKAHPELVINDLDLGANNISAVADNYPGINGSGINVSLKEESYDETDLDLLGRSFASAPKASNISGHATIMATLIGGNGNSFINGLGAAPLVKFTSSDFVRLLPDSLPFFNDHHISIQNHSYGTGIENYYGTEAEAYDKQIYQADTLVHVFSSGNIGTSAPTTGAYSGLPNMANLSGTFKQAKNVLVVGGTGRTDVPEPLSSSGPAYDGCVKPELVADGEDGTSGAAALTSGTVALLQQAYKKQYSKPAPAALIKAVLINSADDVGVPAVDFKTGYGKLNALEAMRTILDTRFKNGAVANQQQASYQITVPANCSLLKISLGWNDPAATLDAPFALVNDLDLSVTTPGGQTMLPWSLSTYPRIDSLTKPAIRQRDTINNTEQLSIQNPAAGVYTFFIKGARVTTSQQAFTVAYQTTQADTFEWTYPTANSKLFASGDNYLRWQNSYSAAAGKLSVSYDGGSTWQPIADVAPNTGFYKWAAPKAFSKALLKMTINGVDHISKQFVLSGPIMLGVGYDCTDGTLLHWSPQPGATGYNVYTIKDNLLQALATVTDTTAVIPVQMQTSKYFAVSAIGAGFEGIKSYTIDATQQGVGCYVQTLLADVINNNTITLSLALGTNINLKTITWEKLTGNNTYTALGTTSIGAGFAYTFVDPSPKKGINYYRATLSTTDGKMIHSDLASATLLQSNQFTIYPNPVAAQLNILAGELNNYELILYDTMGRISLQKGFNGLQNIIPVNIIPGIYICTIGLNGKVLYKTKVIKL